jgi:hypothetical protein
VQPSTRGKVPAFLHTGQSPTGMTVEEVWERIEKK